MALSVAGSSLAPGISEHALARRTSAQLVQGFVNTSPIAIPEANQAPPSSIFVSGFATTVADVNVTLSGLSHSVVNDLDILLVGPQGQSALLASDVGSNANDVTLTLDDQAPDQIDSAGSMATGAFQPTNFQTPDPFAAPAPASPKGARLAVFNSTDPNGEWRLIIRDDTLSNAGTLADGWSLTITSANGVPNAQPDSNSVRAGQAVTDLGGVLDNDDDPDDDPLTAVLAGEPAKGTVSLQPDGSYTYRANKKTKGTDSFTYLARDPGGLSDLETVTIKIAKKKKRR
jgi:subtilisin-like proprotein convertase family protein